MFNAGWLHVSPCFAFPAFSLSFSFLPPPFFLSQGLFTWQCLSVLTCVFGAWASTASRRAASESGVRWPSPCPPPPTAVVKRESSSSEDERGRRYRPFLASSRGWREGSLLASYCWPYSTKSPGNIGGEPWWCCCCWSPMAMMANETGSTSLAESILGEIWWRLGEEGRASEVARWDRKRAIV
ncbi:uncharacterized protein LY79DRAFT_558531 [Colletotrichum navitas]|uniref:Uncharacterized protein n=1 Tax=Colletotrichum navitas TaxID=681940 RepID=A0AAD8V1K2_9PEZI|nr:uncharacterized protein LY79DRAFT_558531 [Colletotrichum navitas]KAK1585426.1 hypothetical protein LY79DRAFT_558531 [Colletotrichum navitas]